jgi:hypothetical protein
MRVVIFVLEKGFGDSENFVNIWANKVVEFIEDAVDDFHQ